MPNNLKSKFVFICVPLELYMKNNQPKIDKVREENKKNHIDITPPDFIEWPAFRYLGTKEKKVGEFVVEENDVKNANVYFEHDDLPGLIGHEVAFDCSVNPYKMDSSFTADFVLNLTGINPQFKGSKS